MGTEADNEDVVRRFCEAFARRDIDELVDFFTDDGVYHNIPLAPAAGKDAIRAMLSTFCRARRRSSSSCCTSHRRAMSCSPNASTA